LGSGSSSAGRQRNDAACYRGATSNDAHQPRLEVREVWPHRRLDEL